MAQSTPTHLYDLAIWQPELFRLAHHILIFACQVASDIASLLLDRSNHFFFRRSMQVVPRFPQKQLQVIRDITVAE